MAKWKRKKLFSPILLERRKDFFSTKRRNFSLLLMNIFRTTRTKKLLDIQQKLLHMLTTITIVQRPSLQFLWLQKNQATISLIEFLAKLEEVIHRDETTAVGISQRVMAADADLSKNQDLTSHVDLTSEVTEVFVRKSTEESYRNHLDDDSVYHIDPNRQKGKVLIISNDLPGSAEVDLRNMTQLWTALGFITEVVQNYTAWQILDSCQIFAAEARDVNIVVVVVMGHGGMETGLDFFGAEGGVVTIPQILDTFGFCKCPHLQEIPKIFLFQACVAPDEILDWEGLDADDLFEEAENTIILLSEYLSTTTTGEIARGTRLINMITNVFMRRSHDTDVWDMLMAERVHGSKPLSSFTKKLSLSGLAIN